MSIQYSGADALSKDPATKLQQLQVLAQAGVISQTRIAQLLEIPDLESGYSFANNSLTVVLSIIDDCVMKDIYAIPDYVPLDLLLEECINTMMSLRAADSEKNYEDIEKLTILYQNILDKMENADEVSQEMSAQAGEIQATAMEQQNAQQVAIPQQQQIEMATPQISQGE